MQIKYKVIKLTENTEQIPNYCIVYYDYNKKSPVSQNVQTITPPLKIPVRINKFKMK